MAEKCITNVWTINGPSKGPFQSYRFAQKLAIHHLLYITYLAIGWCSVTIEKLKCVQGIFGKLMLPFLSLKQICWIEEWVDHGNGTWSNRAAPGIQDSLCGLQVMGIRSAYTICKIMTHHSEDWVIDLNVMGNSTTINGIPDSLQCRNYVFVVGIPWISLSGIVPDHRGNKAASEPLTFLRAIREVSVASTTPWFACGFSNLDLRYTWDLKRI